MKTAKFFTVLAVVFFLKTTATNLVTAGTSTFANPCQPFSTMASVPNTYGCFSFTAANGGASDPLGYYSWNFGDGTTATGSNVLHCYSPVTVTTVYTIVVGYTSLAQCGPQPTQQSYTMALNPPQGTCVKNTPSVSLAGSSATVWAGIAIPEVVTQYIFGDGSLAQNTNTHVYATCGNYIITVKDWDMNLPQSVCYAYAAVNMTCTAPNPNPTGIDEKTSEAYGLTVFPNPASQHLTLVSKKAISGIKIVDVLGREYEPHTMLNSTEAYVPLSEFTAGAYFAKVRFRDGSENTVRFIKQ